MYTTLRGHWIIASGDDKATLPSGVPSSSFVFTFRRKYRFNLEMTHSKLAAGPQSGAYIGTQSNHGATAQVQQILALFSFFAAVCAMLCDDDVFVFFAVALAAPRAVERCGRALSSRCCSVVPSVCLSFCVFFPRIPLFQRVSLFCLRCRSCCGV